MKPRPYPWDKSALDATRPTERRVQSRERQYGRRSVPEFKRDEAVGASSTVVAIAPFGTL